MIPATLPVTSHTDYVGPGSTFVAITGMREDGTHYIPLALDKGARTIIIDKHILPSIEHLIYTAGANLVRVTNARQALAHESAHAFNYPAKKLIIIGVTGTKGKTTTAFALAHMLTTAGSTTALISSAGNRINDIWLKSPLTTPQPDYVHAFLHECVQRQITHVVMEVAAQAITCHRVDGIEFDSVIFTNFSREHGEFYATQQEYFDAKCHLINQLKHHAPLVLNADDQQVASLAERYGNSYTFGIHAGTYRIMMNTSKSDGLQTVVTYGTHIIALQCSTLVGAFNAYNIAGAAVSALQLGVSEEALARACEDFPGVPGRLNPREELILSSGARVFIDKAHNPSSYEAILSTLRELTDHLIVVFGAGGERDKERRPLMGSIAEHYADLIILTSDDPRSEDSMAIHDDILRGIKNKQKVTCIIDREHAIQQACSAGKSGSIIILLGKGSDEYQQIGTVKHYFNERAIVQAWEHEASKTSRL